MSYQVLARKWRPKTFETLIGQEHVVRALTHALTVQRLHHAYLFTGTRGVGKTTLARILAKSLNCESGVTPTPCGVCSACVEIDAGRFVDLLEVDAATNTRVDEMRQLLENAVYAPTRGRFKVYVIDEVHMLSTSAFNAMLKTLEEPPEHVKFILATTDPQKIPVTVLSRCLQFNLKQMPTQAIVGHLENILQVEAVPFEPHALHLLARSASGSMRDALSLLDQAIAHGAGRVEEGPVRDMLGTVDVDHLFAVLAGLAAGDVAAILQVAEQMAARSLSFELGLRELAGLLTHVQIAQLAPEALDAELPDRSRLLDLADKFSPEAVQLAYQITVNGCQELPLAPDAYAGFVMTLLRLYAFRPEVVASSTVGRPQASVAGSEVVTRTGPVAAALQQPTLRAHREVSITEAPVPAAQSRSPSELGGGDWHSILLALKLGGMARELANHCELREIEDGRIVLRLAPAHRHLQMKPAQEKLQQALSEHFARPLGLMIEVGDVQADTPAAKASRDRRERQETAVASIGRDTFVQEVIETFDATLIESSIKPI